MCLPQPPCHTVAAGCSHAAPSSVARRGSGPERFGVACRFSCAGSIAAHLRDRPQLIDVSDARSVPHVPLMQALAKILYQPRFEDREALARGIAHALEND